MDPHNCEFEILAAILENSPVISIVIDYNFNVIYMNNASLKMSDSNKRYNVPLGNALNCVYALNENQRCGYTSHCSECGVRASITEAIKKNKTVTNRNTYMFLHKYNGKVYFNITVVPFVYFKEKYLICYLEDITEQKSRELQLERLNNFLLNIIDTKIIWIEMIDYEKDILIWNTGAEIISGYKGGDVVGKLKADYFHKNIDSFLNEAVFEQKIITKDNQVKYMYFQKIEIHKNIKDENGVLIIGIDITQRKKIEYELLMDNKYTKAIFNATKNLVVTLDPKGRILFVNDYTVSVTGYTRKELIGNFIWEYVKNKNVVKDMIIANDIMNKKYETVMYAKDGSELTIYWGVSCVKEEETDNIKYIIFTGENVTEMREMQRLLLTVQKMNAIGKLTGGIAHDFNNILTAIINTIDYVLKNASEKYEFSEELHAIKDDAERGAALTKKLLAFSRKELIKPVVMNINKAIVQMNDILSRVVGEDIKFEYNLDKNVWKIKMDPNQIEQIIMNLVVNSRDAMPGGGTILIETKNVSLTDEYLINHPELHKGDYVVFTISDTGLGMSDEIKEHIFEPFFTTKPKEHGTGLGLSTVYGIVKQNKGFIYVYSEEGKGTTFKIYFPTASKEYAHTKKINDENLKFKSKSIKGSETILLVEDEASVRRVIEKVLKQNGYTVYSTPNPLIAIKLFKENKIDLVLSDIIMPEMNGVELHKKLSGISKNFKVIYMSGYSDNILTKNTVLPKDVNFIQKPFNLDEILHKIREVLDNKQ